MSTSKYLLEDLQAPTSIKIIKEIGWGGSGWVIKVKANRKKYALKVLRPDIVDKTEVKDSFIKEAQRLKSYKHPTIVEVTDVITVEYKKKKRTIKCPAFLMEYLPSHWKELNNWIVETEGDSNKKFHALIRIGKLLLEVINFLHTKEDSPLLHLDIKSENIKVKGSIEKPKIKLLDFGVAQHFHGDEAAVTGEGENIQVSGTLRHWPTEWIKKYLSYMSNPNRTVGIIPREYANSAIDLHLFMNTIKEAFSRAKINEHDLRPRDREALHYYKKWIDRLSWSDDPEKDMKITTAHEALKNANRAYESIARISVLFGRGNLRIPVDNLEYFGEAARSVVDTKEFQRLRGRRQLGFVHYVFPGGVHTRFEHSLGVYGSVIKYLKAIINRAKPSFRTLIEVKDLKLVAAMALVHDLGHYPFSHQIVESKVPGFPHHETNTYQILRDEGFAETVTNAFNIDQKEFLYFSIFCLKKVQTPGLRGLVRLPKNFSVPPIWYALKGMLNGPSDADKFDYLRRDALHVGVPYSGSLDPDRFIDGLTIYGDERRFDLAVKESAISSAEMFALGRYFMYTAVYYNHTVRCFDRLLQEAVHMIVKGSPTAGNELFEKIKTDSDDSGLQKIISKCPCDVLKNHISKGKPYRRLLSINTRIGQEKDKNLISKFSDLSFKRRRRIDASLRKKIKQIYNKNYQKGHLLVDVPSTKEESTNIPIVSNDGELYNDKSPLWESVNTNFNETARKLRVFAYEYPNKWGDEEREWLKKELIESVNAEHMRAEA